MSVSVTVVDQLLKEHNYRKRKAQKRLAIRAHLQRNEQFESIEQIVEIVKDLMEKAKTQTGLSVFATILANVCQTGRKVTE